MSRTCYLRWTIIVCAVFVIAISICAFITISRLAIFAGAITTLFVVIPVRVIVVIVVIIIKKTKVVVIGLLAQLAANTSEVNRCGLVSWHGGQCDLEALDVFYDSSKVSQTILAPFIISNKKSEAATLQISQSDVFVCVLTKGSVWERDLECHAGFVLGQRQSSCAAASKQ